MTKAMPAPPGVSTVLKVLVQGSVRVCCEVAQAAPFVPKLGPSRSSRPPETRAASTRLRPALEEKSVNVTSASAGACAAAARVRAETRGRTRRGAILEV